MPLSDEEARAWIRDLTTALERRNRENAALRAQLEQVKDAVEQYYFANQSVQSLYEQVCGIIS